jgi:CSLREA domain-containing protein
MSSRQRRKRDIRRRDAARRVGAKRRRIVAGAGLGIGAALGFSPSAQAAVNSIEVTSLADPGDGDCATGGCTLREAITQANDGDTTDQDVITFQSALTGTITLNGTQLPAIDEPLWIQGPTSALTPITIDGADSSRILNISADGDYAIRVSDLTLTNGNSGGGVGGAIYAMDSDTNVAGQPDLTIQDADISGNVASGGGGVYVQRGSLTVQNSTVSDNSISGNNYNDGGGIYLFAGIGDTLTIDDSAISGNSTSGTYSNGGGISTTAPLTIDDSTVSNNSTAGNAAVGGGVSADAATITNSTISGNSTTGSAAFSDDPAPHGGGLFLTADATIEESVISGNSTDGNFAAGGGLYSTYAALTIRDSTISGNSTGGAPDPGGRGGGAYSSHGDVTVENSTIANNSTTGDFAGGGGLSASYGTTSIQSSTISGNTASGDGSSGGGVYAYADALTVGSSTIAGNSAPASTFSGFYGNGGGVYSFDYYSTAAAPVLGNTILADNTATEAGQDLAAPYDTFQVAFGLIEDPSGATINETVAGSNITGVDPQLEALADNGGPLAGAPPGATVETHALSDTSPAVDAGSSALITDQRGLLRPVNQSAADSTAAGANCADIGAFELQLGGGGAGPTCTAGPPPPTPTPTPTPTPAAPAPTFNLKAAIKKCKKKFAKGPRRARCIKKAKRKAAA